MEFTGFWDVTLNIVTEIYRKIGANSCVLFKLNFLTPVDRSLLSLITLDLNHMQIIRTPLSGITLRLMY